MLKRTSDQVLNETFSVEDAKACEELAKNLLRGTPPLEFLDSMLDKVHDNLRVRNEIIASITAKENNMSIFATDALGRVLDNITLELGDLPHEDYLEVLEKLKAAIETRIKGVHEDIARKETTCP
jgi:ubiquinone biosynthesis protein COQ9